MDNKFLFYKIAKYYKLQINNKDITMAIQNFTKK